MNKKDLLKRAKDPQYISGIYNYCDRWCERCAFTSRCLTYAIDSEDNDVLETRDFNNKAFWDKLESIFQQTIEMIQELAAARGIDLSSLDIETASDEISSRIDEARNHELSTSSRHYATMAEHWLEAEHSLFAQKQDELNMKLRLGIGGGGTLCRS